MSTSATFLTGGFYVESVVSAGPARIRVRYTADPKQSSAAGTTDGLNPFNYVLTGPAVPAGIAAVTVVSGDTQALDLILTGPLTVGTWTLTVSNVQDTFGDNLTTPKFGTFVIDQQGNATELTAGAEVETSESVLRKHFNPSLQGTNWDAVLAAIASGDDTVMENSRRAMDMLFVTSAAGKYLDRLANKGGLQRPSNVGMSDDLFRKLVILLKSNKITHQALRGILEIFYGIDALHGFAETALEEPYLLTDGQDLTWTTDEADSYQVVFQNGQFAQISQAKAIEIAAVLTKTMQDAGGTGFALASVNPQTGNSRVRIYSGSLGLKSFVRVTGGRAQPFLKFPTYIDVYGANSVVSGTGYNWVYTVPTQNLTLLTLNCPLAGLKMDVSTVQTGDYLVIGPGVSSVPPGTYPVLKVTTLLTGATLTQSITLNADLGFTGTVLQTSNLDYQFFRPTKNSTNAGTRTVIVAQTTPNQVDIQVPATTQAVTRTIREASYAHSNAPATVTGYVRDGSGKLVITAPSLPAMSVGSQVYLDGFRGPMSVPPVSAGTPGTYPAVATADASYGTTISSMQQPPNVNTQFGQTVRLDASTIMVIGGINNNTPSAAMNRLSILTPTTVVGGAANGASRVNYQWLSTVSMSTARNQHAATKTINGTVLISGGVSGGAPLNTTEVYSPQLNTIAAGGNMVHARKGHAQVALPSGKIVATGGVETTTAVNTTERWDNASGVWSALANMNDARYNHQAVVLNDGRIMVIGGCQPSATVLAHYPTGAVLNTTEFYDSATNKWTYGPPTLWARANFRAFVLPDGRVLILGGAGYIPGTPTPASGLSTWPSNGIRQVEIYDPRTNLWTQGDSAGFSYVEPVAAYVAGKQEIVVGYSNNNSDYDYVNSVALNNPPYNLSVFDLTTMKWRKSYLADPTADNAIATDTNEVIFFGGVSSGTTTRTTPLLMTSGVEKISNAGINGVQTVTASGSGTVTVQTSEFAYATQGTDTPTVTTFASVARPTDPGPYIFDPDNGYAITGTSSTLTETLLKGNSYNQIHVASTATFPDSPGWLMISYGRSNQSKAIPYIQKVGANILLLDYSYVMDHDQPSGSEVTLLSDRNAYVPETPQEGANFYATDSSAGRLAALAITQAAAAAGITLNFKTVYPGDRGLGGEGYPTDNASKLSDVVTIWGS